MDCDVPAFEELSEWTASRGVGRDAYLELSALAGMVLTMSDDGCPALDPDGAWSGTCTTSDGYVLEGTAWYGTWGDGFESSSSLAADLTITATDWATGGVPTGTFSVSQSSTSGDGSSTRITAVWAFDDPGTFDLGTEGDVTSSRSAYEGDCGTTSRWGLVGRYQGCDLSLVTETDEYVADDGSTGRHEMAVGTWTASVVSYVCDSTVATIEGSTAFLDDAWVVVELTDADGDHCPVETCDCDDADPTVSPASHDTYGDGLDSDCDGSDRSAWSCNWWWSSQCGEAAPDTGGGDTDADTGVDTGEPADTDTAPPADTAAPEHTAAPPADTPTPDKGWGCGTPAPPTGGLLVALAALLRRRRR